MEKLTEWTAKFKNETRSKPNRQFQEELFHRIDTALNDGSDSFDECVAAFCRFNARVIEPFYEEHYWSYSSEKRCKWDRAMVKWARTNTGKQTSRATIRIVPIIKEKLAHIESSDEVVDELEWLSLNEDDRSVSAFKHLRDESKVSDLRKLLSLDMRQWPAGQAQIFKMFGILFADTLDSQTCVMYEDFLSRHGQKMSTVGVIAPVINKEADIPSDVSSVKVSEGAIPVEKKQGDSVIDSSDASPHHDSVFSAKISDNAGVVQPVDGVKLAETLMAWTKQQRDKTLEQAARIAELNIDIQKADARIASLTGTVDELQEKIETTLNEKALLEQHLNTARATIDALNAEKEKAVETIGQLQHMSGNSVKQELDGFRAKLANALANDVKDFRGEYAEEEKAEVYGACLEDMIDILKSNGIHVEEE